MIRRFLRWLLQWWDDPQGEDPGTDGPPEHWLPLVGDDDKP